MVFAVMVCVFVLMDLVDHLVRSAYVESAIATETASARVAGVFATLVSMGGTVGWWSVRGVLETTVTASTVLALAKMVGLGRIARLLNARMTVLVMASATMEHASVTWDGVEQTVPRRNAQVHRTKTLAVVMDLVIPLACCATAILCGRRPTAQGKRAREIAHHTAFAMMDRVLALLDGLERIVAKVRVLMAATEMVCARPEFVGAAPSIRVMIVLLPCVQTTAASWDSV
jgi:hypothetical protein